MTTSPAPKTLEASPVFSKYGRNKSFLQVVPRDDSKVLVCTTELGSRSLNKFWTAWLRDLLLHKTDAKHVFAVEMRNGDAIVSWSKSSSGLTHAVLGLASQIGPLTKVPLKRIDPQRTSPNKRTWRIVNISGVELDIESIIKSIKLPNGAVVRHNVHLNTIELVRNGCILSTRDLALIVEYRFAIACV